MQPSCFAVSTSPCFCLSFFRFSSGLGTVLRILTTVLLSNLFWKRSNALRRVFKSVGSFRQSCPSRSVFQSFRIETDNSLKRKTLPAVTRPQQPVISSQDASRQPAVEPTRGRDIAVVTCRRRWYQLWAVSLRGFISDFVGLGGSRIKKPQDTSHLAKALSTRETMDNNYKKPSHKPMDSIFGWCLDRIWMTLMKWHSALMKNEGAVN